jgi:hypothetical protein
MIVNAPIALRPLHPPGPPDPRTTANVPSGYSFILLQIRTPHVGVHPLDLSIGVHPDCLGATNRRGAFDRGSAASSSTPSAASASQVTTAIAGRRTVPCSPYRSWECPDNTGRRKASPAQVADAARGPDSLRQKGNTAAGAALDA